MEERLKEAKKKAKEIEAMIRREKSKEVWIFWGPMPMRALPWREIFKRIYKRELVFGGAIVHYEYKLDYDVLNFLSTDTLILIRNVLREMLYFLRECFDNLPGVYIDYDNVWFMLNRTDNDKEKLYNDVHALNKIIIERRKREMEKKRGG